MKTKLNESTEDLAEFKGSSGTSKTADPVVSGNAHRGADANSSGETYADVTHSQVLAAMMTHLAGMGKDEMINIYHGLVPPDKTPARGADQTSGETGQVRTSPTAVSGTGDQPDVEPTKNTKSSNKGEFALVSLSPTAVKPVAKEDIDIIFGGDELSEEVREKATIVFEAAVAARLVLESARLEEEFESKLELAVEEIRAEVVESVDKYLSKTAELWVEDNQLAIDHGLKVEMAEELILSMKSIFENNYIEIPADKIDVVAEMTDRVSSLESQLQERDERLLALESKVLEADVEAVFESMTEGLAATEIEKLGILSEGVFYADADEYKKKISIIKETYFPSTAKTPNTSEMLSEELITEGDDKPEVHGVMGAYVSALSKTSKSK